MPHNSTSAESLIPAPETASYNSLANTLSKMCVLQPPEKKQSIHYNFYKKNNSWS